jgi:hypothetical protein
MKSIIQACVYQQNYTDTYEGIHALNIAIVIPFINYPKSMQWTYLFYLLSLR